jgi:hypothetical protein
MILHWLERSQWEAKLRRLGAVPLEGKGQLNTASGGSRPAKFYSPSRSSPTAEPISGPSITFANGLPVSVPTTHSEHADEGQWAAVAT